MAIQLNKAYRRPTLNIRDHEHRLIEIALLRNKGNRQASANELGITVRTLYRKMNEFDLNKVGRFG